MKYKDYIAKYMLGKKFRFYCDCLIKLDITGIVTKYSINGSEIIYLIETEKGPVKIGENTPNLQIKRVF